MLSYCVIRALLINSEPIVAVEAVLPGCVDVHPRIGIEFHARAIGGLVSGAELIRDLRR